MNYEELQAVAKDVAGAECVLVEQIGTVRPRNRIAGVINQDASGWGTSVMEAYAWERMISWSLLAREKRISFGVGLTAHNPAESDPEHPHWQKCFEVARDKAKTYLQMYADKSNPLKLDAAHVAYRDALLGYEEAAA